MRLLIIVALILAPMLSLAQGFGTRNREQSWDFSVGAIYQNGEKVGGSGGSQTSTPDTSSLEVKSEWGFGFNVTYNFNSRLALGADFDFIRPDYTAILVPEDTNVNPVQVNHRLSQFNGRLKGTYNFTDGPLVPYVDVGFGWSYFDSNVASGPPITGCWWHPWWGYICSNFYNTFSSTETTYGAGVGVRYELRGGAFIKASYNYWQLNSGGNSDDFKLASGRIEYGWNF